MKGYKASFELNQNSNVSLSAYVVDTDKTRVSSGLYGKIFLGRLKFTQYGIIEVTKLQFSFDLIVTTRTHSSPTNNRSIVAPRQK